MPPPAPPLHLRLRLPLLSRFISLPQYFLLLLLLLLPDSASPLSTSSFYSADQAAAIMEGADDVIAHQIQSHAENTDAASARTLSRAASSTAAARQGDAVLAARLATASHAYAMHETQVANAALAARRGNPYPAAAGHTGDVAVATAAAAQQAAQNTALRAQSQVAAAQAATAYAQTAWKQAETLSAHATATERSMTFAMQQQHSHFGLENHYGIDRERNPMQEFPLNRGVGAGGGGGVPLLPRDSAGAAEPRFGS